MLQACGLSPTRIKELEQLPNRKDKYAEVYPHVVEVYKAHSGNVGRILMAQDLRKHGIYVCDQTARNLMKRLGLQCRPIKGSHYSSFKGEHALAPELLHRDFSATRPLEKLVTDITMIPCCDKNLYGSALIDLFSMEARSVAVSDQPTTEFVLDGVTPVLDMIELGNSCIFHSDQGCQYQSALFRNTLAKYPEVTQSMSRKGNCLDNNACESFFSVAKRECDFKATDTYEVNKAKLLRYVDYYNKFRCKPALKGMSPTQFRMSYEAAH